MVAMEMKATEKPLEVNLSVEALTGLVETEGESEGPEAAEAASRGGSNGGSKG